MFELKVDEKSIGFFSLPELWELLNSAYIRYGQTSVVHWVIIDQNEPRYCNNSMTAEFWKTNAGSPENLAVWLTTVGWCYE